MQSGNGRFLAHILMMAKLASLVRVGSEHPPRFIRYSYTITYKVAVYAPAEQTDTLPLFHLYPYIPYSVVTPIAFCLFESSVFPGWISIVCTRIQYVWGGGMGFWPHAYKHLPQSHFTGPFFRWQHFALPSMSLIFLWVKTTQGNYYDNLGYLTIMALYLQLQV